MTNKYVLWFTLRDNQSFYVGYNCKLIPINNETDFDEVLLKAMKYNERSANLVRKQLWERFDVINTDNYINTFGKVSINHIERKNKNNKGIRLFKL